MSEKDYSLMRPFDEEAAKRGEEICTVHANPREYICGPDAYKNVCVKGESGAYHFYHLTPTEELRMAPLSWVEGRPVYKDDVLYYRVSGCKFNVKQKHKTDGFLVGLHEFGCPHGFGLQSRVEHLSVLTWDQPRPKQDDGWITWNGGERPGDRPVAEDVLVEVKLRCGDVKKGLACTWYACWRNDNHQGDIVAYRVVDQPKPAPKPVKRWINLYPRSYREDSTLFRGHETKEAADKNALADRLACIEIELPPLAEVSK